jgi:nucleoside-triphosphatase
MIRLAEELRGFCLEGFYTKEIRERNTRQGFELVGLDGRKSLLAHVDIHSRFKVGKYGVDVQRFERFLEEIPFFQTGTEMIIVDEIGKMECFSPKFLNIIREALDSSKWVMATIAMKGTGFIQEVKQREDVHIYELSLDRRDHAQEEVMDIIKRDPASL